MPRNKLPDEQKKVRINISIDPTLVKRARELGMYNFSKYCEIAIRNFCNKNVGKEVIKQEEEPKITDSQLSEMIEGL